MMLERNLRRLASLVSRAAKRAMGVRSEEGGALLEFAIALPLLMTVLTGAASFSLAFYSLQQLQNATSSAVQLVANQQGLLTDPCATAQSTVTGALPGWTTSNFKYSMVITDSSGTAHNYPASGMSSGTFSCTAGAGEEAPNESVVLSVSYTYTWLPVVAFSPSSPLVASQAAMAD
jgi:Flp pilus assembly protein TadG